MQVIILLCFSIIHGCKLIFKFNNEKAQSMLDLTTWYLVIVHVSAYGVGYSFDMFWKLLKFNKVRRCKT